MMPDADTKWKFLRGLALVCALTAALLLTYDRCITCVIAVAIFSAVTMTCVPLMPLVFLLSMLVLMMHAIDYNKSSIRVEVPLQDMVYIPSWDDVKQYVHVTKPA